MSSNEDNELLGAFIEESVEHLADIEGDLLAIEQGGAVNNEERVNKVFRAIHSIKGGAGFMGLHVLQDLAHAAENVLGLMRTRKLTPTPEVINGLLLATDRLKQHLANISCSNEIDISAPVAILNAIAAGDQPAATSPPRCGRLPRRQWPLSPRRATFRRQTMAWPPAKRRPVSGCR